MVYRTAALIAILLVLLSTAVCGQAPGTAEAGIITKEELLPLVGKPDVTIIDLRFGRDWYDSKIKIKSAVREDPMKPGQWLDKYPKDRMLVLYCD